MCQCVESKEQLVWKRGDGHGQHNLRRQISKFLDAVQSGDEKFAHIVKEDVDKVEKLWTEKNNWFGSRMTQMHNLKPYQDPIQMAMKGIVCKGILW